MAEGIDPPSSPLAPGSTHKQVPSLPSVIPTTYLTVPTRTNPIRTLYMRRATFRDLWPSACMFSRSFAHEALFSQFIHPFRAQYPTHMARFFYQSFLKSYFDPTHLQLLIIDPAPEPKKTPSTGWFPTPRLATTDGRVVGSAQFHRLGNGARDYGLWRTGWVMWVPVMLAEVVNKVFMWMLRTVFPNRATTKESATMLERVGPYCSDVWVGEKEECLDLKYLGVDPEYEGLGLGKKLTQWGLQRAEAEGICASVVSADGKEKFYLKCGYDEIVGRMGDLAGEGEGGAAGNPLRDVPGGCILFKWVKDKNE